MEDGRRRRTWEARSGTDHISGLPDELLHGILCRLHSAAAAARTSVLSRRWRRVWADLPELVLGNDPAVHHGASFLDAVDAALAAYSTAALHSLEITMPIECQDVPALRVASWLRFASRRLAGELHLHASIRRPSGDWEPWSPVLREGYELELPPCERATSIKLWLGARFLLRLLPAGTFATLAELDIALATVQGWSLEALVSTQCPRLRKFSLRALSLVAASDVSLGSSTLQHLNFDVQDTLRLYVSAPKLQVLYVESNAADVYVAAPNLAEVVWGTNCAQFVFADAGRHLRRLEVKRCDAMAPLMRRFNSADELSLRLCCPIAGGGECKRFLDDANCNLPKCQTLCISSAGNNSHAFAPTVLHLLRRGNGIRKLNVIYPLEMCSSARLCSLPKSSVTDNTILDSLEEIEISLIGGSADESVEFLNQLLFNIWSNTKLKSVKTNMWHSAPSLISEICKKIHAMCPPNIRIKSNVFPVERRARFETSHM